MKLALAVGAGGGLPPLHNHRPSRLRQELPPWTDRHGGSRDAVLCKHARAPAARAQLELQTHEMLVKHWRSLARREARAAKEAGEAHVPAAQRPEAAYIPSLLSEYLEARAPLLRHAAQRLCLVEALANGPLCINILPEPRCGRHTSQVVDGVPVRGCAASCLTARPPVSTPAALRALQVLKAIVPEAAEGGAPAGAEDAPLDRQRLLFCERFLEFAVDLLSQLPTRRFVRTLLDDRALLVKCRLSGLFQHAQGASAAAAACARCCAPRAADASFWACAVRGSTSDKAAGTEEGAVQACVAQ